MEKEPEITKEESAQRWTNYIKSEVNTLLDIFLPDAIDGTVGVKYQDLVTKQNPGYDEVDKTRAQAVTIKLVFNFEEPINKPNN